MEIIKGPLKYTCNRASNNHDKVQIRDHLVTFSV